MFPIVILVSFTVISTINCTSNDFLVSLSIGLRRGHLANGRANAVLSFADCCWCFHISLQCESTLYYYRRDISNRHNYCHSTVGYDFPHS